MCWVVARRDDVCVARLLHREAGREQRLLAGPGAVLDNYFHVMRVLGMTDLLANVHGIVIPRDMAPCVPSVLLYGLKKLFGIEP
jgi:hypothetical protein